METVLGQLCSNTAVDCRTRQHLLQLATNHLVTGKILTIISKMKNISNIYSVSRSQQDPVYEWWKDLFIWTEPECMTYLQSKPIPVSSSTSSMMSSSSSSPMSRQVPAVYYPYETIRHTLENKRTILETFSILKR